MYTAWLKFTLQMTTITRVSQFHSYTYCKMAHRYLLWLCIAVAAPLLLLVGHPLLLVRGQRLSHTHWCSSGWGHSQRLHFGLFSHVTIIQCSRMIVVSELMRFTHTFRLHWLASSWLTF